MGDKDERERVAVVGAGIAGLASAFLLHEQGKRVTLYESEPRCGGHALTVDTKEFGPIDLGFQARFHTQRDPHGLRTCTCSRILTVSRPYVPTIRRCAT